MKPLRVTETSTYRQHKRFWRWRAWRHRNPLRRHLTPLERIAALGVAALGSALVTLTVVAACLSFFSAERSVRSTRVVHATVISTESPNPVVVQPQVAAGTFVAHLRWNWQGVEHSTDMPVLSPPPRGSTVNIRVNDTGRAVANPWSSDSPVPTVLETVLGGFLSTVTTLFAAIAVLRQWLLRRRATLWQSEWARIAPLWCGRG